MASLSGPNPLSVGEFQQEAGQAGVGSAVGGISGLAAALAGNPQQLAQAKYLGAETGRAQAQTGAIAQTQADGQSITNLLKPQADGSAAPVQNIQGALAIAARNPEIAARIPSIIAAGSQVAANMGQQGGPTQSQADTLSAGLGTAAIGNTATGQKLDLANRVTTANIGAGPGYAAAAASVSNNIRDNAGLDRRTLVQTGGDPNDPTVHPTYMTAAQAGSTGAPAYQGTLANTIAGQDNANTPVLTPAGPQFMTNRAARETHAAPLASSPAQVQATVMQGTIQPPPNSDGSASAATSSMAGTFSPEQKQTMANSIVDAASGRPPPAATSLKDTSDLNAQVTTALQKMYPSSVLGEYGIAPDVLQAVTSRASYLYDHDPGGMRGSWPNAINAAVAEIAGPDKKNLIQDWHVTKAGPSQIVFANPGGARPTPGPAPSPGPSPLAQTMGGARPAPGPTPQAPQPGGSALGNLLGGAANAAPAPQPSAAPVPGVALGGAPQQAPAPVAPQPQGNNPAANVMQQAQAALARATNPAQRAAIITRAQQMGVPPGALGQ